jgi:hypothetical protein
VLERERKRTPASEPIKTTYGEAPIPVKKSQRKRNSFRFGALFSTTRWRRHQISPFFPRQDRVCRDGTTARPIFFLKKKKEGEALALSLFRGLERERKEPQSSSRNL